MNLEKMIKLIAEQIARQVLESAEDHPDPGDEEVPAMSGTLLRHVGFFKRHANTWLTKPFRNA